MQDFIRKVKPYYIINHSTIYFIHLIIPKTHSQSICRWKNHHIFSCVDDYDQYNSILLRIKLCTPYKTVRSLNNDYTVAVRFSMNMTSFYCGMCMDFMIYMLSPTTKSYLQGVRSGRHAREPWGADRARNATIFTRRILMKLRWIQVWLRMRRVKAVGKLFAFRGDTRGESFTSFRPQVESTGRSNPGVDGCYPAGPPQSSSKSYHQMLMPYTIRHWVMFPTWRSETVCYHPAIWTPYLENTRFFQAPSQSMRSHLWRVTCNGTFSPSCSPFRASL